MSNITTEDGTTLFFKDWGSGQPIVFSHAWALSADEWDPQMMFFLRRGYRVIAHDRRGHGRSTQTSAGHNMDTYADDLAAVVDSLGIENGIFVGHSMGGGEVVRYIARHGAARVSKAALISSVPPFMLQGPGNPTSTPREVFDQYRKGVTGNRSQSYQDFSAEFYGYDRPGAVASEGLRAKYWLQAMLGGANAHYDAVAAFSETDFTADLEGIIVPTLFMHGDADQLVPMVDSSIRAAKLVKNSRLIIYPGFPHGMCEVHADRINEDLLGFIRA
jgi:non-heme chloroperoxidase